MKNFTEKEIEELLKLSFKDLVDAGICPTCFDKITNGAFFGDDSKTKFYEDEDIVCSFVSNPRAEGHIMIGSKVHYHDMSEAPDYLNEKIIRYAKKLMNVIKETYNCERVYFCTMCDGPANHYHVQLIPRYSFEERGSTNFVKPRQKYVYNEEKFKKLKQELQTYANKS